ncbi:unnamed protein product [Oppiella nova]|uniref:Major facilitator superfamily (MFS) profile domain-containing protein n=1 Tax=Oppiella nova TaxID=334625 RepID=A0A7R9QLQ3_9ACAR|nr:unnamed protein product [Oppiella nova]CAG2168371.1 unnamed protein product [Oppiella nova]
MEANKKLQVKHITDLIGEWGKWQFLLSAYVFLMSAAAAFINMGYSFHAKGVDYWCSDVPHNQSFDLVCERTNYASLTQSFFMLGYVASGFVISYYSDKYGRRPMIYLSYSIEVLAIISCAFSYNIYQYIISRFLVGFGHSGGVLECCGPKHRADIVILTGVGWVLGYVLLPGFAYWLQDFRYMQFMSAIPMIIMLIWFYYLYESPRWQLANGRVDEAEITIRKALQMNGKSTDNLTEKIAQLAKNIQGAPGIIKSGKTYNMFDLLKTPNLRKYSLILWYSWIINALVYYGISFNMSDFGGNFYITFVLAGLMELPSQLFTPLFLKFIGRRKLYAIFMAIVALSSVAVIPSQKPWLRVLFALISKYGISSSWNILVIYAAEIYPTVIRNIGMGTASVVGRIGSVSAPFMGNLTIHTSLTFVMIFYGIVTAVGAILGLYLPETKDKEIPDTLEEAENLGKNDN